MLNRKKYLGEREERERESEIGTEKERKEEGECER